MTFGQKNNQQCVRQIRHRMQLRCASINTSRASNSLAADPHHHQWLQVVFQILLLAALPIKLFNRESFS